MADLRDASITLASECGVRQHVGLTLSFGRIQSIKDGKQIQPMKSMAILKTISIYPALTNYTWSTPTKTLTLPRARLPVSPDKVQYHRGAELEIRCQPDGEGCGVEFRA